MCISFAHAHLCAIWLFILISINMDNYLTHTLKWVKRITKCQYFFWICYCLLCYYRWCCYCCCCCLSPSLIKTLVLCAVRVSLFLIEHSTWSTHREYALVRCVAPIDHTSACIFDIVIYTHFVTPFTLSTGKNVSNSCAAGTTLPFLLVISDSICRFQLNSMWQFCK